MRRFERILNTPMRTLAIRLLSAELHPLLSKFYRAQRSQMRPVPGANCWVATDREIIAGLCMSPVAQGYWLTGLLVAPEYRSQGVAQRLIEQALESVRAPVWLFCHPRLAGFYQQFGFTQTTELPETLDTRLRRYVQHKPLIALAVQPIGTK